MTNSTTVPTLRFDRHQNFNPMMLQLVQSTINRITGGGFRASGLLNSLYGTYDGFYYTNMRERASQLYSHDLSLLRDLHSICDTLDTITAEA
tara:strand:- start:3590 stop:3865 length:276 start_codon:yes stop_codon:yes gene_type:complete